MGNEVAGGRELTPMTRGVAGMSPLRHGRRTALRRAGLLLAGAVIAVVILIVVGRDEPAPHPAAVPADLAPPRPPADTVLGIPLNAVEPCSIVDLELLGSYGSLRDPRDLGTYASCTVDIFPPSGGSLRASVEFLARYAPDTALPGVVEKRGDIAVSREPENDGICRRTILLADNTPIILMIQRYRPSAFEPCIAAETLTKSALTVLTTTGVGRSTGHPANSLASVDMCGLVGDASLRAAGFDPAAGYRGFAGWSCQWSTQAGTALQVYVDRQYEVDEEPGKRTSISGREVIIQPGGYSGRHERCVAQITHRRFLASNGEHRIERVQIVFDGEASQGPDELCRTATALAESAVSRLPRA